MYTKKVCSDIQIAGGATTSTISTRWVEVMDVVDETVVAVKVDVVNVEVEVLVLSINNWVVASANRSFRFELSPTLNVKASTLKYASASLSSRFTGILREIIPLVFVSALSNCPTVRSEPTTRTLSTVRPATRAHAYWRVTEISE
jgi:hypothetical protein